MHLLATYILKRVNALCALLNLTPHNFRDELSSQLRQIAALRLTLHNINHLLADLANLTRAGISSLLNLIRPPLGETDSEEAEEVVVGGFDNNVGLNEGLPLPHERAELVRGEVEAVEVGEAVLALHFVDAEFDFAEGVVFVLLEVGEGDFEDAAFEGVVGVLQTC